MEEPQEGSVCWADAMFADPGAAKSFYTEVLGWEFGEARTEFGEYTQAYADGRAVAAVVPPPPGQGTRSAWCLYFATADAAATERRVREMQGEVVQEPTGIGSLGTMMLAREPAGALFGLWQSGQHKGFEKRGERGALCWSEILTRDPVATDAFFAGVFPYRMERLADEHIDFAVYLLGGEPVLGRMRMTDDFPAGVPPFLLPYFGVGDCDVAVTTATDLGATLQAGPMTTPFGRFASITDPQGATFAVIDTETREGAMPSFEEAG